MAIITISRGSMSGGQALAECLCATLGVPCVGREAIAERAASALGVSSELLSDKMETAPGLWERLTLERHRFTVAMQAALAAEIVSGNVVYHGNAGQLLLRGVPGVLRVRLIAPLEMRIKAVVERHGLSRSAAEAYISQVDEERLRWSRFVYDTDLREPSLYDLLINLERLTIASACAVVVEAARRPEFDVNEEVRAALADFGLACQVKLALATAPATRTLQLEVASRAGLITVTGEAPRAAMLTHVSNRLAAEIESVVSEVEGVKGVKLDLEAISEYR